MGTLSLGHKLVAVSPLALASRLLDMLAELEARGQGFYRADDG
jgi:hypothetical protein